MLTGLVIENSEHRVINENRSLGKIYARDIRTNTCETVETLEKARSSFFLSAA